jgi:long-chain acyl-CoA synthetase
MEKSGYDVLYAVPDKHCEKKEGETLPYRSSLLEEDEPIPSMPAEGIDTIKKQLISTIDEYGTEPFLGSRQITDYDEDHKPVFGKYIFRTYNEVFNDIVNLAKSFNAMKLYSEVLYNKKRHKLIGVYAKNCEGWVLTDFACCFSGLVTVTLYDTLGGDSSEYIIKQSELKTVVCTADHIKDLIQIKQGGGVDHLQNLVIMDTFDETHVKDAENVHLTLYSIQDLVKQGETHDVQLYDPDKNDLFTICYTSGTTGNPKGVMLSHENMIALITSLHRIAVAPRSSDVHISYLPLAHVLERIILHGMMSSGARVGFYQGDVFKLKEDMQVLRPTVFASVPRLYSRFYDVIQAGLAEAKGLKKKIATKAINAKLANLHKNGKVTHCLYDALVFKKMRNALGGRVRYCITGSAPISKEVIDFLKIAFCCPIYEGYGQTENTGAACATFTGDSLSGHVGGILPTFLLKLEDVPEMNYFSTDQREGETHPRGEVCLKGPGVFVGYFKEPEKTAETLDKEGWLHTGDIGEIQPNGALRIIDRKKNIFKLSQGEYIAAEKLELLYAKSPLISQIFVYGDSLQAHLVAIVIPDRVEVEKQHGGKIKDFQAHINSKEFHDQIIGWFNQVKKEQKLNSLEVPKTIYCSENEFKVEDGTLTPTFKLVRAEAKKKFIDQIREMYGGAKLQGE